MKKLVEKLKKNGSKQEIILVRNVTELYDPFTDEFIGTMSRSLDGIDTYIHIDNEVYKVGLDDIMSFIRGEKAYNLKGLVN